MNGNVISDLLPHIEELISGEFFDSSRDLCSLVLAQFNKNSELDLDLKVMTLKLYGDSVYGLEEYERSLVYFVHCILFYSLYMRKHWLCIVIFMERMEII